MSHKISKTFTKIKILFSGAILTLVISALGAHSVFASTLTVAQGDDLYGKLREAALMNTIMNGVKKCFPAWVKKASYIYMQGVPYPDGISPSNAKDAKIFIEIGSIEGTFKDGNSTALWLEDKIGANGGRGVNGGYFCYQSSSANGNVLNVLATEMGRNSSITLKDLLCDGGHPGLIAKYEDENGVLKESQRNCSTFDSNSIYGMASNWDSHLRSVYERYRTESGNQYLISYDGISNYENVDGYFNYIEDFNFYCKDSATGPIKKSEAESGVDYSWITQVDRSGGGTISEKIVFKNRGYHMQNDKTWDLPLTNQANVKTCSGLLERISVLENQSNHTDFSKIDGFDMSSLSDDRDSGYLGIIAAKLKNNCKDLSVSGSTASAWTDVEEKLKKVKDDKNASEDDKRKAEESLKKISDARSSSDWTETKGDPTSDEGMTLQCLDIEQMQILVDEFETAVDDMESGTAGTTKDPSCFDNTGAMGWILCPLVEQGGSLVEKFYQTLIEPFLEIDVGLFSTTEDRGQREEDRNKNPTKGIFEAWQMFQGIANLAFVAVFMVIIISQITGYGVDNYGIKKILPKLIVGAILINASYLICQLCVEVANIAGLGIKGLFNNVGNDVETITLEASTAKTAFATVTTGLLSVSLIALLIQQTVLALDKVVFIIFLIVFMFLAALLFLFAILSLRYALTIILVIISPLAFVCYMLPNTKPVFKKWFSMFKGLLLAYPMSSAMIYGGEAVARILITSHDSSGHTPLVLVMSAAIMGIAPVFLIPSSITKTLGAIGGVIGNLRAQGNKLAKGSAKGIGGWTGNTRMGMLSKNTAAERLRRKEGARDEKTMAALKSKIDRGDATEAERRRYNRLRLQQIERENELSRSERALHTADYREQQEQIKDYKDALISDPSFNQADLVGSLSDSGGGGYVTNEAGEFDQAKTLAALSSISKGNDLSKAIKGLSNNNTKFREALASDSSFRNQVASIAGSKSDGMPMLKAMSKELGKMGDIKEADQFKFEGGDFGSRVNANISGMENSSFSNFDTDSLDDYDVVRQMTAGQWATVAGAGITGNHGKELNESLEKLDEGTRTAISASLSSYSGVSAGTAAALAGVNQDYVKAFSSTGSAEEAMSKFLSMKDSNGNNYTQADFDAANEKMMKFAINASAAQHNFETSTGGDRSKFDPALIRMVGQFSPISAPSGSGGTPPSTPPIGPSGPVDPRNGHVA